MTLARAAVASLVLLGAVLLVLAWALLPAGPPQPVVINGVEVPPVPTLSRSAVAEGKILYAQHCAACHGANLQGAADWKIRLADGSLPPPPQDSSGHTWHHPDNLLLEIVRDGGDPAENLRMPGFGDKLNDTQITAILSFLKSRWGDEERAFQWWMTATQPGEAAGAP